MRYVKLFAVAIMASVAIVSTAVTAASAEPGFLPKTNFIGSGSGGTLETLGNIFSIKCTGTKVLAGVMSTDSHGTADVHYTGCKAAGSFAVNSLGDGTEVILAPSTWLLCLAGNKENAALEWAVWLEPTNPVHIEIHGFSLELLVVVGGIPGKITLNTLSKTKDLEFSATSGDPSLKECFGTDKVVKTANQTSEKNHNGKPESSGLKGLATLEAEDKKTELEIMDN